MLDYLTINKGYILYPRYEYDEQYLSYIKEKARREVLEEIGKLFFDEKRSVDLYDYEEEIYENKSGFLLGDFKSYKLYVKIRVQGDEDECNK